MKIIKKLKALFYKEEEPVALDLRAAEIREGRAFLHPKHEKDITYLVKSNDIEIRLSKGKSLSDDDILVIKKPEDTAKSELKQDGSTVKKASPSTPSSPKSDSGYTVTSAEYDTSRFKKRVFSVALYPEEYDRLMFTIQQYGYKRAEFIMASADTATKGTMAKAQQKIRISHTKMRKEERELKQNYIPQKS